MWRSSGASRSSRLRRLRLLALMQPPRLRTGQSRAGRAEPSRVQQPNIVQQVARNVSEAIHDIPDDLDVPTFLRHRTQKA